MLNDAFSTVTAHLWQIMNDEFIKYQRLQYYMHIKSAIKTRILWKYKFICLLNLFAEQTDLNRNNVKLDLDAAGPSNITGIKHTEHNLF